MKHPDSKANQRGFTIIELLIATAVLSTILLLVTTMMLNIGKLYYKGMNQARIQDNVRTITNEVSEHLQLGDNFTAVVDPINPSVGAYCIGSTRYTYVLNKQIPSQSLHALWRDNNPSPGSCPTGLLNLNSATPSAGGAELIGPNSRLTNFTITGTSPYNLSVSAAYGDDDLLNLNGVNTTCKGAAATKGGEFCATAKLQTAVVRRLP